MRRPQLSRLRSLLRPRTGASGLVTYGALLAVVTGSLAAVVGTGQASSVVRLLDGGAWLASFATGSVSHVHGPTGAADAAVSIPAARGAELEVVQDSKEVYVLNRSTGEVGRIDAKILDVTQRVDFGDGPALDVAAGEGIAYVIDREKGVVQLVNPETLTAEADELVLDPPLSRGVIDEDGVLWLGLEKRGAVVPVRAGEAGDLIEAGDAGDELELVLVNERPAVINKTRGTVAKVSRNGLSRSVGLPAEHRGDLRVGRKHQGTLALVSGTTGTLIDVDLDAGTVETVDLGRGPRRYGAAQRNGERVYVPEEDGGALLVVDTRRHRVEEPIDVDGDGKLESFVKDEFLYVNRPASDQALIVDRHGASRPVSKSNGDVAGNNEPPPTSTTSTLPPPTAPRNPESAVPRPPGSEPTVPGGVPTTDAAAPVQPPLRADLLYTNENSATFAWGYAWGDYEQVDLRFVGVLNPGGHSASSPWGYCCDIVFEGVPAGDGYTATIWAEHRSGKRSSSVIVGGVSVPGPPPATPSSASVSAVSPSEIRVTWQDNSDDEDGFRVTASVELSWTTGPNATSYTIGGLAPGTYMCINVKAFNEAGTNGQANAGCTSTPVGEPPGPPRNVTAEITCWDYDTGCVTVSFNPPADSGTHPVDYYYTHGVPGDPDPYYAAGSSSPLSMGVRCGKTITFTVWAVSYAGEGQGATSNPVTPPACP